MTVGTVGDASTLLDELKLRIDPEKTWTTDENNLLTALLADAEANILEWRYSYCQTPPTVLPTCFKTVQLTAALIDYCMLGMQNETTHKELDMTFVNKYTSGMDYIRDHVISFVGL